MRQIFNEHEGRDRACPVYASANPNPDKFQNKYRATSIRLQFWDYRWAGAYFITICTHHKKHFFGEIEQGVLNYSAAGAIADVLWYEIKNHHTGIDLGGFVVMPNHIHGILILHANDDLDASSEIVDDTTELASTQTGHALSLLGQSRFQNIGKKSVSSIIGGYKSAVTKHTKRLHLPFAWQPRFYEHIIRDELDYERVAQYIENNPQNWTQDRFWGASDTDNL